MGETIPAAHARTQPPAPAPAAATATTAATLPESTHALGPNHAGHAMTNSAAGAANAVCTANGTEGGAEAHPDAVSRNVTPAVAIAGVVAVDWGPLRMALAVAIADCAGAMRLARVYALLAMAAMSLRLARIYAQVVYIHGSSSHQEKLHSAIPSTYRIARTCQTPTLIHRNVFPILCMEGVRDPMGVPVFFLLFFLLSASS